MPTLEVCADDRNGLRAKRKTEPCTTGERLKMDTAKIVRFHALGGPDVLQVEDLPMQEPGPGEIRLKVQAIGLNRADVMFRTGQYMEQPEFPSRIGLEAAGVVDAIGPGVTQVEIGQQVSVATGQSHGRYGTCGESAIVPVVSAIPSPDNLTPQEAASVWVQYLTAYFAFVDLGNVRPGQFVLLTAATGSAGLGASWHTCSAVSPLRQPARRRKRTRC
jgi:NADPH:quinone reductase-like Zn-dependent oxidoreductase